MLIDYFDSMIQYRNIPFAYLGMKVKVDNDYGFITGSNDSSNLNVTFIDGKYKDSEQNCHPHSNISYYDDKNVLIKEY